MCDERENIYDVSLEIDSNLYNKFICFLVSSHKFLLDPLKLIFLEQYFSKNYKNPLLTLK